MKAIVVDDEVLALESMVRLLTRMEIEVIASFQNPLKALQSELWADCDAAFIDITMPGMNGIELAAQLQSQKPSLAIVFVTAFDQYAVKAFEIAAVDYLVKPVRPARLSSTLERLRRSARQPVKEELATPVTLVFMRELGIDCGNGQVNELQWRTTKAKELFAYLIHERERAVSKEQLQDLLWQDLDAEKAMANLHTTVYQIRQTLKNVNLPVQILYAGGRYRAKLGQTKLDCTEWERELDLAVAGRDEGQLFRLLMDGYRGDYLQAEGYWWAENERERLRIIWLQQAYDLALRLEQAGLQADANLMYQAIQSRFPTWESCYLGLMRTYDQMGDAHKVKHTYEQLHRILKEELDIQPGRETTDWYASWADLRFSDLT